MKNNMNIVFIGGDKRQKFIYEMLKKEYQNTSILAYGTNKYSSEIVNNCEILVLPTVLTKDGVSVLTPEYNDNLSIEELLGDLVKCRLVIGGIIPQRVKDKFDNININYKEYTENESFKTLNAIPTVEGAISIAIHNTNKTLWKSNCLIIGNGCIGKRLSKTLRDMGSNVTITARKEFDFAIIESENLAYNHTNNTDEIINNFDIIFNTVPKKIVSKEVLNKLSENIVIIDLASYPYGFDYTIIDTLNCKIIPAQSLPGKYSPITAADIAAKTVKNIIDEV